MSNERAINSKVRFLNARLMEFGVEGLVKFGWEYYCDSGGLDIISVCKKSIVTTGRQFFKRNALKKLNFKISVTPCPERVTSKSNVFDFQRFLTFFNTIVCCR